ncbi:MAG: 16S rRNA (uracil(1498)-N(3))-methyltransferase [Alphaproteobacteria bacterium]|nr:16S rRNA (uracil(1498)-N(3))-methyltransferase [Alphaproteobacteria bacterium]
MSIPRLFTAADLGQGLSTALAPAQAHYLRSVLRLGPGALLALFNGRQGEWRARLEAIGKGACTARILEATRPQEGEAELDLVFAPVKRARIDFLVEKATELGVTALRPVWTARTVVERINLDRLRANAIEAAEQTERLSVPAIEAPQKLAPLLAAWPAARPLLLCDERGGAPPLAELLSWPLSNARGAALLVGPEGGFTETELDALEKFPFVKPVGLGPRVLRADTAALAALAVFQALAGDWRRARIRAAAADRPPPRPCE